MKTVFWYFFMPRALLLLERIAELWSEGDLDLSEAEIQRFRSLMPRVYRADSNMSDSSMSAGELRALEHSNAPDREYQMVSGALARVSDRGDSDGSGGNDGSDDDDAVSGESLARAIRRATRRGRGEERPG